MTTTTSRPPTSPEQGPNPSPLGHTDPDKVGGLVSRRNLFIGAGVLVGGISAAVILGSRNNSTEPVPDASAPNTPGNTTTQAPSETAKPTPSASAETTSYVRKNNLPQVSDGGSHEKWDLPGAARVSALVAAAKTREEAVLASKTVSKDDIKSYVESWVYKGEADKTNDFIDKVYTQNPKAFPKSLIDNLNRRGPGKEKMTDAESIVDDFNVILLIASRIAQDDSIPKAERQKVVAVILSSMEAPSVSPNLTESIKDYGANYSYLLRHDYQELLDGSMDRKQGDALKVVPFIVVDTAVQATLKNHTLRADMNILVDGKPSIFPIDIEVMAVRIFNDSPDKDSVLLVVTNKSEGSYFTLEQVAKFLKNGVLYGDTPAMVANIRNEDTKKPLFTKVVNRLVA